MKGLTTKEYDRARELAAIDVEAPELQLEGMRYHHALGILVPTYVDVVGRGARIDCLTTAIRALIGALDNSLAEYASTRETKTMEDEV